MAAGTALTTSSLSANPFLQEEEHKFDKELQGPPLTSRRMAQMRSQSMIRFARFLQKELGEEEVIDLIKKDVFEKGTKILAIHTGGLQGIEGMNLYLKKKELPLII